MIRRWREGRRATPDQCEHQALLWQPMLSRPNSAAVAERTLTTAGGHHVRLSVYLQTALPVEGRVLAYGTTFQDCLAIVFDTSAQGGSARRVVAQRLAHIAEGLLPELNELSIDARVPVRSD